MYDRPLLDERQIFRLTVFKNVKTVVKFVLGVVLFFTELKVYLPKSKKNDDV